MLRTVPFNTDWLKSPRRSSSVGTVRTIDSGRASFQFSNEVNEKMRLRTIGPPTVPPNICSSLPLRGLVPGGTTSVGSVREFIDGSRK